MTEEDAWAKFRGDVEAMRRLVLDHPLTGRNPQARAEAMALIHQAQASAYTMVIAPRQHYPRFFRHSYFEPTVFSWNLPNPDFLYQIAYLDGARDYRIRGRRNDGRWTDIQSMSGNFGEASVCLGNFDLDEFEIAADGSFEIAVSARRRPGNWIPTDAASGNNLLLVRRLVYDWEDETPPDLAIEAVGEGGGLMNFTEAELARRVALAGDYVRHVIGEMNLKGLERLAAVEDNEFVLVGGAPLKNTTANPIALYAQARYAFEPGEALVLECDLPEALYWNFHLGDIWNQTRDFIDHLSTINGRQAAIDPDGRFRAVLALEDPGVPNWLDPVGTTFGRLVGRWYGAAATPSPTIRRVSLRTLRDHLPAGTPNVTPEARREQLRRRRAAMLRHWGYGA